MALNLLQNQVKTNTRAHHGRIALDDALLGVESAVDIIGQVSKLVEQKLNKDIPPDVTGAIQEFNAVRERLDLVPYRAFKNLENLVSKHQGLIEKRNRLTQFKDLSQFRELLDYFYSNIAGTDIFLSATNDDRSEIIEIVKAAECEVHFALFEKYFREKKYKSAQVELNWLRDHQLISESDQNVVKLEKIINDSSKLEEFISKFL